nr:hypothetical protein [uncultured Flavobacterium sp.]
MKKLKVIILYLSLVFVLLSCNSLRNEEISSEEKIPELLIKNYYSNYKSDINKYDYFWISHYNLQQNNLIMYRISPEINKVILGSEGDGYYPDDYILYKSKCFFINGKNTSNPNRKIFDFLKNRNMIDSTMLKLANGLITGDSIGFGAGLIHTDERIKGATYVFRDSLPYKLVRQWRTNKGEIYERNLKKAVIKKIPG